MKQIIKNINLGVQIAITILFLVSCFAIDRSLFNGLITAKSLWIQGVAVFAILYLVFTYFTKAKIQFKTNDVIITAFCFWMIGREYLSKMPHSNPENYILQIIIFYFIYLFFRSIGNKSKKIKGIIVIYLLIISAQAIIGLLQLYGFINSYHALFKTTGTFHNPGPFSGFIVSGLPIAFSLYLMTRNSVKAQETKNKEQEARTGKWFSAFHNQLDLQLTKVLRPEFWNRVNWDKILNFFSQFVIIVLLLILPAARSRAAWLGGIIGCIFILLQYKEQILKYINPKKDSSRNPAIPLRFSAILKKRYAISFILIIVSTTIFGLYKLKQGSADGRLLMWQVSWEMIKEKPLLGYGQGGFDANYANYQAEWFKTGKGTYAQEMVAGSPEAPFNELIRVVINYGVIGALFVLVVLYMLFRKDTRRTTEYHKESSRNSKNPQRLSVLLKGGLLSTLIFSIFSYTLDITPMLIQIILTIALLTSQCTEHQILNTEYRSPITKALVAILLITVLPFIILNLKNNYSGLKHWEEAHDLYKYELYSDASEEFNEALMYLPKNGLLLQMQAKCYTMFKYWDDALTFAEKAQNFTNGQILNIVLGDTYKNLKNYNKSEEYYKRASWIIPHKFFPRYLLAKMYDESGQKEKAIKLAKELLNKEIKIESTAIEEMRIELNNIINTREQHQEANLSQNIPLPVQPPLQNPISSEERR